MLAHVNLACAPATRRAQPQQLGCVAEFVEVSGAWSIDNQAAHRDHVARSGRFDHPAPTAVTTTKKPRKPEDHFSLAAIPLSTIRPRERMPASCAIRVRGQARRAAADPQVDR
jgi:hypothetical protein